MDGETNGRMQSINVDKSGVPVPPPVASALIRAFLPLQYLLSSN